MGRLVEALLQHQRIGVDTAPFIYLWEKHPRYFAIYNIHVPDALHLATALIAGATVFITNDRRLTKIREINVLVLDDYTT